MSCCSHVLCKAHAVAPASCVGSCAAGWRWDGLAVGGCRHLLCLSAQFALMCTLRVLCSNQKSSNLPLGMPAGFSLGALEQLLAENQRLAAVEAQSAGQASLAAQLRELQVGLPCMPLRSLAACAALRGCC